MERHMRTSPMITIVSLLLVAGGFLLPLWFLSVLGLLLAALTGRYFTAIAIGLLLDIAFGVPTGLLHVLYVPFTLLAGCMCALRYFFGGYFREEGRDTL